MDVRLVLSALEGGSSESGSEDLELPRKYVEALFDSVAETYEDTIIPAISYQVPNELVTAITKSMAFDCGCASGQLPANEWALLDLGCGTGLSGASLRGTAKAMAGCDVSKNMCAVARRKGMYATVEHTDAVSFLGLQPPAAADLLVAGDVFPYMKDLQPLFDAAARALKPAARFAFTTEEDARGSGDTLAANIDASSVDMTSDNQSSQITSAATPQLNSRTRFWHSEAYIKGVADAAGLQILVSDSCSLHKQALDSKVVAGRVYVLQTPPPP